MRFALFNHSPILINMIRFYLTAVLVVTLSFICAQAVFPIGDICLAGDEDDSRRLLPLLNDRLPFTERPDDTTYLYLTAADPRGAVTPLLASREVIRFVSASDTAQYYRTNKTLYVLHEGASELDTVFTASRDLTQLRFWRGKYYYVDNNRFVDRERAYAIFSYDPATEMEAVVYSNMVDIEGLTALKDYLVFVRADRRVKTLERIDENGINSTVGTLFTTPDATGLYTNYSINARVNDNKLFFNYGFPGTDNELRNVFFADANAGTVNRIGSYESRNATGLRLLKDGVLYFAERRVGVGNNRDLDLFRSDGTAAGTYSLNPFSSLVAARPTDMVVYRDAVWFIANFSGTSNSVYKTDGTVAGTERLPFVSGDAPDLGYAYDLQVFNDSLFLRGQPASTFGDTELYVTADGTPATTRRVADLNPGREGSGPTNFRAGTRRLFFRTDDFDFVRQTFVYDLDRDPATLPTPLVIDSVVVGTGSDIGFRNVTVFVTGNDLTYSLDSLTSPDGVFSDLTDGTYTVTVTDGNGCSDAREVVINFPVAIRNSPVTQRLFRAYPNPADRNGIIRIAAETGAPGLARLLAYDLTGRLLSVSENNELRADQDVLVVGVNAAGGVLFRQLVLVK